MASSELDICNAMLINLGSETVNALSDNNKRAKAFSQRYADLRDSLLRLHPWNFAIKSKFLVDISGLIKNSLFTTGIQGWTDSSDAGCTIDWSSANKTIRHVALWAGSNEAARSSQSFTVSETTTVKIAGELSYTDTTLAAANYIGIGTTAGDVDLLQVFFAGVTAGESINGQVILPSGTYYMTTGTVTAGAGTINTEIDNVTCIDIDTIYDNFDYTYRFELPSDWLRTLSTNMDAEDFNQAGGELITDASEVRIRYISRVTDVNDFDPAFAECLAAFMAVELAVHLVDSDSRLQMSQALYKDKLRLAKFIDSQEGTADVLPQGRWLDSRRSAYPN